MNYFNLYPLVILIWRYRIISSSDIIFIFFDSPLEQEDIKKPPTHEGRAPRGRVPRAGGLKAAADFSRLLPEK